MKKSIKKGLYEHYKGKKYEVLGIGKHSETLEDLVFYEAQYKNELSQLWARPVKLFTDAVEVLGKKVQRFRYIGEE